MISNNNSRKKSDKKIWWIISYVSLWLQVNFYTAWNIACNGYDYKSDRNIIRQPTNDRQVLTRNNSMETMSCALQFDQPWIRSYLRNRTFLWLTSCDSFIWSLTTHIVSLLSEIIGNQVTHRYENIPHSFSSNWNGKIILSIFKKKKYISWQKTSSNSN